MAREKVVTIGTIGAGYAAHLHGRAYERVHGLRVRKKTVCDTDPGKAQRLKETFGYEQVETDYRKLLKDPEIDVIDIVLPPILHVPIAIDALRAEKHVICEKPLTGYFGAFGQQQVGMHVARREMYRACLEEMDRLVQVAQTSGTRFMYAENFVYAPPIQKAAQILRAKKSKTLFMKGEESVNGSSSPVAGKWSYTGGGVLTRTGTHPLGGMLWLKAQEAQARGEEIHVREVTCDVGQTTFCLSEEEHRHMRARPEDVEDYGVISIGFSDGTKALCIASDTVMGGTKNYIEIYANNTAMTCNLTPTDLLSTYFLDEEGLEDVYISEMLPQKLGWNKVFINDEMIRGYVDEMQDFMECAAFDREPASGLPLAYEITKVMYAAYMSAEEGQRIQL